MNILTSAKKEKPQMTKAHRARIRKTNIKGWVMISFPFIGFLCFTAIPMFYGLYISLFELHSTLLETRIFVGFENYTRVLTSEMFYRALGNTFYYTLSIFFNMGLALFLAYMITAHDIIGHKLWRIVLFLPQVCSSVAVVVMWTWLLNENYGVINTVLRPMGLEFMPMTQQEHFMPAIFLISLWRDGVNIILLQSALVNVNKSLHEAARLDGARESQVFWKITFPAILPTLFYMLITNFIAATQEIALFQIITGGGQGPGSAGVTVAYYIIRMTGVSVMQDGYGMSSALSWIFAIFLVIITRILMWLNNKYVCYE